MNIPNEVNQNKPLVLVLDRGVCRNYLFSNNNNLEKIFDEIEKHTDQKVEVFTVKSIIDSILNDGNFNKKRMERFVKIVKIVDVSTLRGESL